VAFPSDDNVCFGSYGLTDPIGMNGDVLAFRPIRIDFDPPVRYFRFSAARSIGAEFPIVKFYVGASEQQATATFCTGPSCRRYEGASSSSSITHVVVASPNEGQPFGYTVSALTAIRDPQPTAGPFIRVAQESAPGLGDFDQRVLGITRPWRAPRGWEPPISDVYFYDNDGWNDVSYDGPPSLFGLEIDASRIGFVEAREGLSLVVIHDKPKQQCPLDLINGGGHAEMRLIFDGVASELTITIQDGSDPTESYDEYEFDAQNRIFTALSDWNSPNTDGFALSGFAGDWTALVSFTEADRDPTTPPFSGLKSWAASSSDGPGIPLTLQADLRVQLKAICLADVNGNCRVDLADLMSFASCMHGPDAPIAEECEPFDIDPDGDVDLRDFAKFERSFSGSGR